MSAPSPQPDITAWSKPYWDALAEDRLTFQACVCGHRWLPPRAACPHCLGTDWRWETACGRATLVSWTVFHVAYHEAFTGRTPYNVALVELAEGPRMITNVVDAPDGKGLAIGQPLAVIFQREGGTAIARFQRMADSHGSE